MTHTENDVNGKVVLSWKSGPLLAVAPKIILKNKKLAPKKC